MALVSGRPISFQMDLYQPLYVARPTVEPELFASLRPPTYSGAMRSLDARTWHRQAAHRGIWLRPTTPRRVRDTGGG